MLVSRTLSVLCLQLRFRHVFGGRKNPIAIPFHLVYSRSGGLSEMAAVRCSPALAVVPHSAGEGDEQARLLASV